MFFAQIYTQNDFNIFMPTLCGMVIFHLIQPLLRAYMRVVKEITQFDKMSRVEITYEILKLNQIK